MLPTVSASPRRCLVALVLLLACHPKVEPNPNLDRAQPPASGTILPPSEVARPEHASEPPPTQHVNGARPPRPMPGAAPLPSAEVPEQPPASVDATPPPEIQPPPQVVAPESGGEP
jgi:hypothetical protein